MSLYLCQHCWETLDYDDWDFPDDDEEGNLICPLCGEHKLREESADVQDV